MTHLPLLHLILEPLALPRNLEETCWIFDSGLFRDS